MPVLGKDCVVTLNSNDISGDGNQLTMDFTLDNHEVPAFGNSGWMDSIPGLAKGTFNYGAYWNKAASRIDATMWPLVNNPSAAVAMVMKPEGGSAASGKIQYSANVWASKYTPTVPAAQPITASAVLNSTGVVTRAVL